MRIIRGLDLLATWLLAAAAGLLAARQLWGDRWGWLGLLNSWAEWTQRGALALAAWLIARGHPERALMALPAVLAAPVPGARPSSSRRSRSASFTLMSANLFVHNRAIERHVDLVRQVQPDLICLQELKPAFVTSLDAGLDGDYPHRAVLPHVDAYGFGVYSRLPIEHSALWSEPGIRPFAQRVYVHPPRGGTVALYNVHLCPPTAGSTLQRGSTWGFRTREAQIAFLQAEIEREGLPAIVVGDHNFSDTAEAYRMAISRWEDGWHQGGSGSRWTWPTRAFPLALLPWTPALLRLDFCFLSGRIRARTLRHLPTRTGSDHRVLLATLELTE